MRGFVGQKLRRLEQITGKSIEVSEGAIHFICSKGFHDDYGARDLNRAVDELLGTRLTEIKFAGEWDAVRLLGVTTDSDGQFPKIVASKVEGEAR